MVKKSVGWHEDEDLHPEHEHWMRVRAAREAVKRGVPLKDACRMHGVEPEELKEK